MEKSLKDIEIKQLLSEALLYRDANLDTNGKRNIRDDIPMHMFPIFRQIVTKFQVTMEVGYTLDRRKAEDPPPEAADMKWLKVGEVIASKNPTEKWIPYGERHTEEEIMFTEEEITLLHYCWSTRNDVQACDKNGLLEKWFDLGAMTEAK